MGNSDIRLVICDMDGTLFDKDEVLSDRAIRLSKELRRIGVMFSLATGRVEYLVDSYARRLNLSVPYVACNGATIVKGKEVIMRKQINVKPLREIIDTAFLSGMSIIYSIDGKEFVWNETEWIKAQQREFDRYKSVRQFTEREWSSLMIDKLSIMDEERKGEISKIESLAKALPSLYGYTRYVDRSVEIVDGSANKASGVEALASYLNLSMKNVMAIGDHQNDIEMIERSGLGVAVANATAEVKSRADYVSALPCIDGVIDAVKHYIPNLREVL